MTSWYLAYSYLLSFCAISRDSEIIITGTIVTAFLISRSALSTSTTLHQFRLATISNLDATTVALQTRLAVW